MAFAGERLFDLRRSLPKSDVEERIKSPKTYTEKELTAMMLNTPSNLLGEQVVETPAGTWHIEDGISIFDAKPFNEVEKITRPDSRTKIISFVKAASKMY